MSVGAKLYRQNRQIRQNEKRLLLVQDNLQSTLDAIPDSLFEMSLDGVFHRVGRAHTHFSSITENFIGKNVTEIYPSAVVEVFKEALNAANEKGHALWVSVRVRGSEWTLLV